MCQKIQQELIDKVKKKLEKGFLGGKIEVVSLDGVHLELVVESEKFLGMSLVEQHKLVMSFLKEMLDNNELHSVKIKTRLSK